MARKLSPLLLAAALAACGESPQTAPMPATAPASPPAAPATSPAPPPAAAADPATPAGSALPGPTAQVPERFVGEWERSAADCGARGTEARLRIGSDQVGFHESSGPVRSVERHGEREITVRVEVTGEGQTRLLSRRWRLSPDGDTLQDVTEGQGLVRQRCPLPKE